MEHTNDSLSAIFRASGLTQAAFCKQHGITLERLRYHLYRKKKIQPSDNFKKSSTQLAPSFISLHDSIKASSDIDERKLFNITIIQGSFTVENLSLLLREISKAC